MQVYLQMVAPELQETFDQLEQIKKLEPTLGAGKIFFNWYVLFFNFICFSLFLVFKNTFGRCQMLPINLKR